MQEMDEGVVKGCAGYEAVYCEDCEEEGGGC